MREPQSELKPIAAAAVIIFLILSTLAYYTAQTAPPKVLKKPVHEHSYLDVSSLRVSGGDTLVAKYTVKTDTVVTWLRVNESRAFTERYLSK